MEIELREYARADGKCPFRDWLRALKDAGVRAKIRVRLNRVRKGNMGDCKSVGSDELRMNFGPGYRAYLGRDGNSVVLLLCGGDKKTQKKNIETAKSYWKDYKRRKNG